MPSGRTGNAAAPWSHTVTWSGAAAAFATLDQHQDYLSVLGGVSEHQPVCHQVPTRVWELNLGWRVGLSAAPGSGDLVGVGKAESKSESRRDGKSESRSRTD
eukprot:gene17986-biopygen2377